MIDKNWINEFRVMNNRRSFIRLVNRQANITIINIQVPIENNNKKEKIVL